MTRQDWLTAGVTAMMTAMVTVGLLAPPWCWADGAAPVKIPTLPSTQLTIPSIQALVSATATAKPGEPAQVTLTVKMPAGASVTEVPVTVTVTKTENNLMSRSMPMPKVVAMVQATVPVGADGHGTATVALPAIWDTPAPTQVPVTQTPKTNLNATVVTYLMTLSSSLGGQAAPTMMSIINIPVQGDGTGTGTK